MNGLRLITTRVCTKCANREKNGEVLNCKLDKSTLNKVEVSDTTTCNDYYPDFDVVK